MTGAGTGKNDHQGRADETSAALASWRPLLHEAGIASQCLGVGLTTLRKANHAQPERYYHAFFSLTIGLERLMKLTILVASVVETGNFPTDAKFRRDYGHDLQKLLSSIRDTRLRLDGDKLRWKITEPDITNAIVKVLSAFAVSTRYYNLDLLTGRIAEDFTIDPVAQWAQEVGRLILDRKYSARQRERDIHEAEALRSILDERISIIQESEDGAPLLDAAATVLAGRLGEIVQKESTFCCMALVRYIVDVLVVLNHQAFRRHAVGIPCLYDFFSFYRNDDQYLRSRKTIPT